MITALVSRDRQKPVLKLHIVRRLNKSDFKHFSVNDVVVLDCLQSSPYSISKRHLKNVLQILSKSYTIVLFSLFSVLTKAQHI